MIHDYNSTRVSKIDHPTFIIQSLENKHNQNRGLYGHLHVEPTDLKLQYIEYHLRPPLLRQGKKLITKQ